MYNDQLIHSSFFLTRHHINPEILATLGTSSFSLTNRIFDLKVVFQDLEIFISISDRYRRGYGILLIDIDNQ